MGGHGGLNILPQKSWNVYGARNRARVAEDEAQAAIEAQNARVAEAAELSRQNLQAMRARVAAESGGDGGQNTLAAMEHVNLFSDVEAAERNAEHEAARKREDARLTAKLMPDLDLSKSAREPAPWYARAPPASAEDISQAPPAPSSQQTKVESSRGGESDERKRKHQRFLRDGEDGATPGEERKHKHSRHHKRSKHHKHHKHERERGSPSSEGHRGKKPAASSSDADALTLMRQERLARERRELIRTQEVQRPRTAVPVVASGARAGGCAESGAAAAGGADGGGELLAKWLALTGQGAVTLKPRSGRR